MVGRFVGCWVGGWVREWLCVWVGVWFVGVSEQVDDDGTGVGPQPISPSLDAGQDDEDAKRAAALEEQKKKQEEEEEEVRSNRSNCGGPFRRQGLPCNVVVDRQGDLFIHLGRMGMTEAVMEVLELRLPFLRKMHATQVETPLSKDDTKEVLKQLFQRWCDNPSSQQRSDEALRCSE